MVQEEMGWLVLGHEFFSNLDAPRISILWNQRISFLGESEIWASQTVTSSTQKQNETQKAYHCSHFELLKRKSKAVKD
jgi:hypothetical protein